LQTNFKQAARMNSPAGIDTSSNESIPEKQQSGLGVASFTLLLVSIIATVAVFGYVGYVEINTEGGVAGNETQAMLIGFAIIACVAMLLVGMVLGIVGLLQTERRRTLAAIGVGLNGLFAILKGVASDSRPMREVTLPTPYQQSLVLRNATVWRNWRSGSVGLKPRWRSLRNSWRPEKRKRRGFYHAAPQSLKQVC
jgi:hypothetical protein